MPSIADKLATLLSKVRRPGDFHAMGVAELRAPRLEVLGVGPLALPLLPAQAEQLIAVAERAPYGRGVETLVDTTVRKTWQIGADRVRIDGKHWAGTMDAIVARACDGLGVDEPVAAELYKLLIYDEGSHFVSHRDTEKSPGMFATLLITLPSLHSGGDLLVRHKGREVRLAMRCEDPSEVAFAAFYADCVHEVLPVSSGYRMVLVYNLLRQGGGRALGPPNHDKEQAGLEALLRRWSAAKSAPDDDSPEKLVFPLEHAYTSAELSFPTLKGADAAAGAVLTAAAARAGCDLHVALLTVEESGSAEYTGYSRRSRWQRDDDGDEEFEIGEIFESSRTLSGWVRPDGSSVAFGPLPFEDDELCPADALADMEPDEQQFQEATGNEGASFERTYSRAALVLWPKERRLAVLNQGGLPVTLPYLGELAGRWAAGDQDRESPVWREAHQLAGHMLRRWQKQPYYRQQVDESAGARMLGLMVRLKDTERVEAILADVIATGGHGKGDNDAVQLALGLLPAPRAGKWLERIVAANAEICPCSCADLLARVARVDAIADHLAPAGKALLLALPGDPARASEAATAWRAQPVDAGFVVDSVTALSRIDPTLADAAVDHLLAWPMTYGLDAVILPAVRQMVPQQAGAGSTAAFQRLRAACLDHLHARLAILLEAPADWTRAGTTRCQCGSCLALGRFLVDPGQRHWAFKASEADRRHLEDTVRSDGCDLDCATDKRGRPYTLLCTKNQASYDRRAAQRQQDLEDLARLGVPG